MSTKPVDAGRFAVDGSDADASNISAPSSGLRDTGFPDDYVPPASEFNYLENVAYRWRKYLSDGALQGNHSIAGDLAVSGALSVGGLTTFGSGLSITGALGVTGLATLGTASITGAEIVGGSLGVTGLITATAGLTAGSNQHVTLSGTGRLKYGTRELNVHAANWAGDSGSGGVLNSGGFFTGFSGAGFPVLWVPLEVGTRVLTVQIFYNVNGSGLSLSPEFRRINHVTGVQVSIWTGVSDTTGSTIESQASGTLNHTVLSGEAYYFQTFVSSASHRLYGATVTYDCP